MTRPELLAPAGDRERFDAALSAGADAIYVGSTLFSMRAAPKNFDANALREICEIAHKKGVKIYLTLNTVPTNAEIDMLPAYIRNSAEAGIDAFIVADIGVLSYCKKYAPDVDIHISTQAGIVNYLSANEFYNLGAKRIVTAREISLDDIAEIRAKTPKDLEIECFVHGAMCVSFSGRCLLSHYLVGRDANRGACAQPCRWEYALVQKDRQGHYFPIDNNENGTYILNSKDMCMIEHIPELIKAGVSSFKIEGRAKTEYYTAVVTNAYRSAVDAYLAAPSGDFKPAQWILDEVYRISHRDYCTGFFFGSPRDDAQIYYKGGYIRSWEVAAIALKSENGTLTVSQRNRFFEGDELEIMNRGKAPTVVTVKNLKNALGESVDNAPNPMAEFTFDCDADVPAGAFIRRSTDGK